MIQEKELTGKQVIVLILIAVAILFVFWFISMRVAKSALSNVIGIAQTMKNNTGLSGIGNYAAALDRSSAMVRASTWEEYRDKRAEELIYERKIAHQLSVLYEKLSDLGLIEKT